MVAVETEPSGVDFEIRVEEMWGKKREKEESRLTEVLGSSRLWIQRRLGENRFGLWERGITVFIRL